MHASRHSPPALLLPLALLLAGCDHLQPAPAPQPAMVATTLISPWDANPLPLSAAPFDCGPAPVIAPDLTVTANLNGGRVSDSVQQAVYAESDTAVRDLTHRVTAAAGTFRRTGSQAAAQCVVSLLSTTASTHGMAGLMASTEAWQQQNHALHAIAIAYLEVRASLRAANALPPDADYVIAAWMDDIAARERQNAEAGPCGPSICVLRNHYGLSVASAAATVAIVANDHALFHWAIGQYRAAVLGIDERGMLHFDSHGQYALNFTLASTTALVQIAELGEVNGEPLYAYDDGRLHLLIHTVTRGLVDPSPFSDAAGADQRQHPAIEPWQVSWAAVYNRRFPDPVLTTLLQQVGPAGDDMWAAQSE